MLPLVDSGEAALAQQPAVPSRWSVQRNRVKLDLVAMALQRIRWASDDRPGAITLWADASPQGGVEVFNSVWQRVVGLSPSVTSSVASGWSCQQSSRRKFPVAMLARGLQSGVDNLYALLHQI